MLRKMFTNDAGDKVTYQINKGSADDAPYVDIEVFDGTEEKEVYIVANLDEVRELIELLKEIEDRLSAEIDRINRIPRKG